MLVLWGSGGSHHDIKESLGGWPKLYHGFGTSDEVMLNRAAGKLRWRSQEVRGNSNRKCSPGKAASSVAHEPQKSRNTRMPAPGSTSLVGRDHRDHCSHLRSEPGNGRFSLSQPFPLSVTVVFKKINLQKINFNFHHRIDTMLQTRDLTVN